MKKEQSLLEVLEKEREVVRQINYSRDNQEFFLEDFKKTDDIAEQESIKEIIANEKEKEKIFLNELSLVRAEIKNIFNNFSHNSLESTMEYVGLKKENIGEETNYDFTHSGISKTAQYVGLKKEKTAS